MIQAANPHTISSSRKAITALFPYAVWQGQYGRRGMLNTFLDAARASQDPRFMWCWIVPFFTTLLDKESLVSEKQVAILASPHLLWWGGHGSGKQMIQLWALAASEIPYSDETGVSVVDTLLRIASNNIMGPYIPAKMWLWLNRQPSLPPVCAGRYFGSMWGAVRAARATADLRTLGSYLLLVWSEWDYICHDGHGEMCTMIREDFGGVWMGHQRKALLQHLDHILEQLDLGLDHLQQYKPSLKKGSIKRMKEQYGKLKEVVVEEDKKVAIALACKFSRLIIPLSPLTPTSTNRETLNIHVCHPIPVVSGLECFQLPSTIQKFTYPPTLMSSPNLTCYSSYLPLSSCKVDIVRTMSEVLLYTP